MQVSSGVVGGPQTQVFGGWDTPHLAAAMTREDMRPRSLVGQFSPAMIHRDQNPRVWVCGVQ